MPGNFDFAHDFTARWEGGLSDHPADAGGLTIYGASTVFVGDVASTASGRDFLEAIGVHPLPICRATMLNLTREQVKAMFAREFWQKPGLDVLPLAAATLIYDAGVNCGTRRAVKFAQEGANLALSSSLAVDGILGPCSKKALSITSPDLIRAIAGRRRDFYQALAAKKPSQKIFLRGWLNRVNELEALLLGKCQEAARCSRS